MITGRFGGHRLARGSYILQVVAHNSAGTGRIAAVAFQLTGG